MNIRKIALLVLVAVAILYLQNAFASWDFMFSAVSYSKNIEIETYLLKESQVCDLFSDKPAIHQLSNKELIYASETKYLAIRLRNNGNKGAWGSLIIKVEGREIELNILGRSMGSDMNL